MEEPRQIGPYELGDELGKGGMGSVYRATHKRLKRTVAIKVLPETLAGYDDDAKVRFQREMKLLAGLSHPNIVRFLDGDVVEGDSFLVMELLEGETLEHCLKQKAPLPTPRALRIGREIADALTYMHELKIFHRDLKPANMILTEEGLKLLDFGVARRLDGTVLTQAGFAVGTPLYMAPELFTVETVPDDLAHAADLWALGLILFEAFTGVQPVPKAAHGNVLEGLRRFQPPPLATVNTALPEALCQVVDSLLQRDPRARPSSARQVRDQLQALIFELPRVRQDTAPPPKSPPKFNRWIYIGLPFALLPLLLLRSVPPPPPRPVPSPVQPKPWDRYLSLLPQRSSFSSSSARALGIWLQNPQGNPPVFPGQSAGVIPPLAEWTWRGPLELALRPPSAPITAGTAAIRLVMTFPEDMRSWLALSMALRQAGFVTLAHVAGHRALQLPGAVSFSYWPKALWIELFRVVQFHHREDSDRHWLARVRQHDGGFAVWQLLEWELHGRKSQPDLLQAYDRALHTASRDPTLADLACSILGDRAHAMLDTPAAEMAFRTGFQRAGGSGRCAESLARLLLGQGRLDEFRAMSTVLPGIEGIEVELARSLPCAAMEARWDSFLPQLNPADQVHHVLACRGLAAAETHMLSHREQMQPIDRVVVSLNLLGQGSKNPAFLRDVLRRCPDLLAGAWWTNRIGDVAAGAFSTPPGRHHMETFFACYSGVPSYPTGVIRALWESRQGHEQASLDLLLDPATTTRIQGWRPFGKLDGNLLDLTGEILERPLYRAALGENVPQTLLSRGRQYGLVTETTARYLEKLRAGDWVAAMAICTKQLKDGYVGPHWILARHSLEKIYARHGLKVEPGPVPDAMARNCRFGQWLLDIVRLSSP